MKETKSDGHCMILGGSCYEECPHYYYREFNGCWKPPITKKNDLHKSVKIKEDEDENNKSHGCKPYN